jgi:protein-S-isoprenylcysteine O-methyltransferase Ste14
MSTSARDDGRQSSRVIPRWLSFVITLLIFFVGIPLAHGVVPWIISTHMCRYGWTEDHPGIWNLLGLIPAGLGAALLIWVLVIVMSETPKRLEWGLLTPAFLMRRGPYAFTRNPMYIGELALWLGWAIIFGSVGVLTGFVVALAVLNFLILPREERGLEARFGHLYVQYKNSVSRWIYRRQH